MAVKRLLFYALLLFSYNIAAHVFSQGFRNDYGAVGLLAVFQYGGNCPSYCKAGTVESVDKLGFASLLIPVTDVGSPGLEIFKVAA